MWNSEEGTKGAEGNKKVMIWNWVVANKKNSQNAKYRTEWMRAEKGTTSNKSEAAEK